MNNNGKKFLKKEALIKEIIEVGKIALAASYDEDNFGFCEDAAEEYRRLCYKLKDDFYNGVKKYYAFRAQIQLIKQELSNTPYGEMVFVLNN